MRETNPELLRVVLDLVTEHRRVQEARYGQANVLAIDGTGPEVRWLLPYTTESAEEIELALRRDYEDFEEEAPVSWLHLVREEFAEVAKEDDPERLLEELVQLASLCVSWAERLIGSSRPVSQANPGSGSGSTRGLPPRPFSGTRGI